MSIVNGTLQVDSATSALRGTFGATGIFNIASADTPFTLAAIGSSANANGATLSAGVFNLQPASASFGGVVTTGTQSIAGAKTFTATDRYLSSASGVTDHIDRINTSNVALTSYMTGGTAIWNAGMQSGGSDYSIARNGVGNIFTLNSSTSSATFTGALSASNLVLGSTFTTTPANAVTLTTTGATNVTLPTSGTLYGSQTGSFSSASLRGSLTDETGSGVAVFNNSPALITPDIGAATATTVNSLTLTAPVTGATLTLANNSSLITSGAFSTTLTSTGTTNVTLPTSGTLMTNPMTSVGDIIQGTTAGAPARLASVATGNALISGGVTTANSWGKIGLTTHVSGTLPVANGGTGSATQNFVDLTTNQTVAGEKTLSNKLFSTNSSGPAYNNVIGTTSAVATLYSQNNSGTLTAGVESSTGGSLFTGTDAYAGVIGSSGITNIIAGGASRYSISTGGNHDFKSGTVLLGGALSGTSATFSSKITSVGPVNDWGNIITGSSTTGQSYGLKVIAGSNSSDYTTQFYDKTNTLPYLVVRGDGNVGIGTVSPGEKFQVTGGKIFASGTGSTTGFTLNNGGIYQDGSVNMIFSNNGATALTIASNQNIGMGTDPTGFNANADNLVVGTGSGNNGATIYSGSSSIGQLMFGISGTVFDGAISYNHSTKAMGFYTNSGTIALAIDVNQHLTLSSLLNMKNYTVATLPSGTRGDIAYVTDALTPAFLTLVVGGGATVTPVFFNGSQWIVF